MKRFLFFLFCGLLYWGNEVHATHVAGAEIYYEYIGDSTGIARHYKVTLKLYRENLPGNAGLGNTANINVSSSCFPNQNFTVTRYAPAGSTPSGDGGVLTPDLDECVPSNDPNFVPISQHNYTGTVILPGLCANFTFSWNICCRNGSIDNLVNPLSRGTYVEAKLNNLYGPNNSPKFITPAAKAFCSNNYFVWSQATIEPDGDSVQYTLGPARENAGGTLIPYSGSYTAQTPMTVAAGTALSIDNKTGTYRFTTGPIQEVVVVVVEVKEYRYDTVINLWTQVGSSTRDMQVVIAGACKPDVIDGPEIDVSGPGFYTDTVSGGVRGAIGGVRVANDSIPSTSSPTGYDYILPVIDYNCLDSSVTIKFDVAIQCESISPDGTDFRVIGPDTIPRPVIQVIPNCDIQLQATEVRLKLLKPLTVNGDYFVYIKTGNDGNTLTNKCGFELREFYTFMLRVAGCFIPSYAMRNVTIDNNYNPRIEFELDTNSFPTYLLDYMEVYRSDDMGATYNMVSTYNGQLALTAPTWSDLSLNTANVNSQNYDYRIKVLVNGESYDLSNSIRSILLDTMVVPGNPLPAIDEMPLKWSRYNGWANPEYTVMLGDLATGTWNPISQSGSPTADTTFYFQLPADSGDYAIRIDASDPAGSNYVASSNWILFSVTIPPIPVPDDVEVPNVFTPNGDAVNDFFTIKNIQQYSQTSMTVFNRWGVKVYETTDYTNDWDGTDQKTGQKLADGVYYYIINMKDEASGKTQNFEGSVTIFNGK